MFATSRQFAAMPLTGRASKPQRSQVVGHFRVKPEEAQSRRDTTEVLQTVEAFFSRDEDSSAAAKTLHASCTPDCLFITGPLVMGVPEMERFWSVDVLGRMHSAVSCVERITMADSADMAVVTARAQQELEAPTFVLKARGAMPPDAADHGERHAVTATYTIVLERLNGNWLFSSVHRSAEPRNDEAVKEVEAMLREVGNYEWTSEEEPLKWTVEDYVYKCCCPESPVSINGRRMTRQELLEFERDAYEPPYKQEVLSVGPVSVNAAGDEAYATVCGRLTYAFRSGADTFGLPRKGVASTVESYFLKKVDGTWRVAEEMWDMKPCGEC